MLGRKQVFGILSDSPITTKGRPIPKRQQRDRANAFLLSLRIVYVKLQVTSFLSHLSPLLSLLFSLLSSLSLSSPCFALPYSLLCLAVCLYILPLTFALAFRLCLLPLPRPGWSGEGGGD